MTMLGALFAAVLFGGGIYLVLHRDIFDALLGVALISQGVNIAIIVASGWTGLDKPPVIDPVYGTVDVDGVASKVSLVDPAQYADPLPQALILTAIVIGFGLLSFLMVLAARAHQTHDAMDVGELPADTEATVEEHAP